MGFFKKIGNTIKKNVSFKNAVKLVKQYGSFIPVVGGVASGVVGSLSDAHEAKLQQREADAQAQANQSAYDAQNVQTLSPPRSSTIRNPNFGEIMTAGAGGALTSIGNQLAGTSQAGQAGATLVNSTLSTWLHQNWLKLVGGILGGVTVIFIFVKMLGHKKVPYKKRY